MPEVSLTEWNTFLKKHPDVHILQTGEWGELKSAFGWDPVRIILDDGAGAQILFRRLPLGLTLAYMPKPVASEQLSVNSEQFWAEVDTVCKKRRAVFLKIELDTWDDSPLPKGKGTGVRVSSHNIHPHRTIVVDLCGTEDETLAFPVLDVLEPAEKAAGVAHPSVSPRSQSRRQ